MTQDVCAGVCVLGCVSVCVRARVRVLCHLVWNHLNVIFPAVGNAEFSSGGERGTLCFGLLVWHLGMDGILCRRREEGDCLEQRGRKSREEKTALLAC